jgi:uncharacterized protein YecE (DUF72 family)
VTVIVLSSGRLSSLRVGDGVGICGRGVCADKASEPAMASAPQAIENEPFMSGLLVGLRLHQLSGLRVGRLGWHRLPILARSFLPLALVGCRLVALLRFHAPRAARPVPSGAVAVTSSNSQPIQEAANAGARWRCAANRRAGRRGVFRGATHVMLDNESMAGKRADAVRIGTSGWNYPAPGYGPWTGVFYPLKQGQIIPGTKTKFDELVYYAQRFNTVEVNNTFYRPPAARVAQSWAKRTPRSFEFSLKLFKDFTHKRDMNQADVDVFKRGIEPLATAGKLGALLCQFPASFKRHDASVEYLTWLMQTFRDHRCAVELRHRSWSDDFAATLKLLNEHDAAFVQIDEPKFKTSIRQNQLPNITSFYYLRAHGRNWKKWWRHEHKDERYDYLYTAPEIQEFGETLKAVKKIVNKAYAYMNNHADAKAPANAIELKHLLNEPVTIDLNPEMLKRYPELKNIVPVATKQDVEVLVRKR